MPTPTEHKTVQARILAYASAIGWTVVPKAVAEQRRGFDSSAPKEQRARGASAFFDELLYAKVCEFNPRYTEAQGALLARLRRFRLDVHGNRDFITHLRNRGTWYDGEEKRERDLVFIDYAHPENNVYEVTEEYAFHNGHYGTREDIVFLINGIPLLVVECKNATKDEAIALGVDQIRRYHRESPELLVAQQLFTATDAIGFAYGVTWNTVRRNIFSWNIMEGGLSSPPTMEIEHASPPIQNHSPLSGEQECSPSMERGLSSLLGEQECSPSFYQPGAEITAKRNRLPHWQQGHVWVYVTWRLGDAMPAGLLRQWQEEKETWLKKHPEPWDTKTQREYVELFNERIDHWLDQGMGSCVLRDPENAAIVANALHHFDGDRYEIASFVVMPNHVHVLFRPLGKNKLENILKSWKGYAARELNKRLGKRGSLWQEDYWDRLVRSPAHFEYYSSYIADNPSVAGLSLGEYIYFNKEGGLSSPPVEQECSPSIPGRLEAKTKTFFAIPRILALLKDYIVFAEKDEELQKYILRQHQTAAVEASIDRALDTKRTRGLVWHTQGSGKTYTMIKTAELLFRATEADKPTVLLMIDRNELEDQMLKNLAALGLGNLEHATSIARLNELLRSDYRGIVVTMIHKFRDMPADINTRKNIYVLIDEAHRTTGGDLGNYLMAGLPNATYIGFTGTPVDKTAYGQGTFKTFGCEDDKGYLHKYSISDSITDGTTLPLYYQLAPNEMLVPHETLDAEFLSLAETEGIADVEELNKILERAVNLKNFLKGEARIEKVARFVADHYRENVEPLGYKAFLVGVDREACALYKHALDQFLPEEYSRVVYTGNNNDSELLKEFHLDDKAEREIRKAYNKLDQQPKILIVTEKLLTGFDAPVLYAMYLDKPMRDHTLLQAIARVNRPYENEDREMVKPHGFVLDFVGIFDKLEKALAFDSDEVNAVVKDIQLLKVLFQNKMETKVPAYLALVSPTFNDKDVDNLIEHFRDPERRKEFFKEYKEIEMLYEIISPDAFLRPFIDTYSTLSSMYAIVRKAYAKQVMVGREFQQKTNKLVREHVDIYKLDGPLDEVPINAETIDLIKKKHGGDGTKVINLIKSITKAAEEGSEDPFLVAMAARAQLVQESFEQRQSTTAEALDELFKAVEANEVRKKEQAERDFDDLTYFVFCALRDAGIAEAEPVSQKIKAAFVTFPNWRRSESELRELRKKVTFAIIAQSDDVDEATKLVEGLFTVLEQSGAH